MENQQGKKLSKKYLIIKNAIQILSGVFYFDN